MNAALLPIQAYWQERTGRERNILLLGGAVLLLALVYGLVIDPINTRRDQLARKLPKLRAEVAQFERSMLDVRGQTGNTAQGNDLAALALAAGLSPQAGKIERVNDKQQALHATAAPWTSITNLLGSARAQGWQLMKLSVHATAEPGLVDAELEWIR